MKREVRLAGVIRESVVDGPGWRFVIFAQGCPHHCKGCQNPETFDPNGGYVSQFVNLLAEIDRNPMVTGVTFSGGDPFVQAEAFAALGKEIRARGKNIITYTGYTIEELLEGIPKHKGWQALIEVSDIIVDGCFDLEQKSLSVLFRGSSNQRVIHARQSLKEGKTVETSFNLLTEIAKEY